MRAALVIAGKEIREALRNRWVMVTTGVLGALSLTLTFLGSAPTGTVGVDPLDIVIVSLSSLAVFLVPLLALLISHDAIAGEAERGTLLLLLSYPVSRASILAGKFVAHLGVLAFAILVGFGAAALALAMTGGGIGRESALSFVALLGSSILLGGAFVAMGYVISAASSQRASAAGVALGLWLFLVVLYDMALLGALVLDQGETISGPFLDALLLANPTDAYRIYNLAGSAGAGALSGLGGAAQGALLWPPLLLAALVLWIVAPLGLSALLLSRRET